MQGEFNCCSVCVCRASSDSHERHRHGEQVAYNHVPGTDFSNRHTYKCVNTPSNIHRNQIGAQEIRDAVNNDLASKGFTLDSGEKADLYVGYQCSVDQERQWSIWGMGGGLRWCGGMGTDRSFYCLS